jgi:hypothetical protein
MLNLIVLDLRPQHVHGKGEYFEPVLYKIKSLSMEMDIIHHEFLLQKSLYRRFIKYQFQARKAFFFQTNDFI